MTDTPNPQDMAQMQGMESSISGLMGIFKFIPKQKRSAAILVFLDFLTTWFKAKKQATPLLENEETLTLQFDMDPNNGALMMIPVTIDNNDKFSRILFEQGINVSAMVLHIDPVDFMGIMMSGKKGDDVKVYQQLLAMLREAASHPECRLSVKEEVIAYNPQQAVQVNAASETVKPVNAGTHKVFDEEEIDWDTQPLARAVRRPESPEEIESLFPNGYVEIPAPDNGAAILISKGLTEPQAQQLIVELFDSEDSETIPPTEEEE